MIRMVFCTFFLLAALGSSVLAQCPTTIRAPCSCSSTRYEPVSIHCDHADSLESVLKALANPPNYIDSLTISNTPIAQIPEGLFNGFAIRRLVFQNNGLRDFQKGAFSGVLLDSIEELEIRTNLLETIPEHGITELRSLESLVISECQVQNVSEYTFLHYQSRTHLKKLDLSANKISSIPAQGLLGLENLQNLILDKNHFTRVPTDALRSTPTIEDLSLSVNRITQIEPNSLPLPNLKSLSLEVNQIESLRAEVFQEATGLLYLYLSNNRFSVLDPKTFYFTSQLKVLAMSHNVALKLIPFNAFQYTPSLIRLEMTDCSIGNVEEGAFHKTPKIQVITLARNKLKRIGVSMFSTLPYVQSIDVKQNEIASIDDYAFSRLTMLQKLDISGNKLETMSSNTFFETFEQTTQSIFKVLYLYGNPWRCDHQLEWLAKWLSQTRNIQVTAPGSLPARCASPSDIAGVDLRNAEPLIQSAAPTTTKKAKPGIPMRIINGNGGAPLYEIETPTTKSPFIPLENEYAPTVVNPLGTIFIILSIVFIVLLLCFLTIFGVYRAIKKNTQKLHSPISSERGDYGVDTASGFASIYGSSGMLTCDANTGRPFVGLPRHDPQLYDVSEPPQLNRANNWWF